MLGRVRSLARVNALRAGPFQICQRAYASSFLSSEDGASDSGARRRSQGAEFALLAPAIAVFHRTTGHFLVPYHFPIPPKQGADGKVTKRETVDTIVGVPEDPGAFDWPENVHDLNLGRVLHKFATNPRHHSRYPMVLADLRALGLPIGLEWKEYVWRMLTVVPLQRYKALEGHSNVPTDFVIPHGDPHWPEHTWGFRLGKRVHRLRQIYDRLDLEELEDLEQVEFVADLAEVAWSDKVLPALRTYAELHGDVYIKRTFVVPSEAPWPEKAWGMRLGSVVNAIRCKNAHQLQIARDAEILKQMGFIWNHRESLWKDGLLPALETYHSLHGNMRIPRGFVIPSHAPWPPTVWGHALGVTVNHIRAKNAYKGEIQEDLDRITAIGFIWSMREYRWRELILPSLEVFAQIYGHCRVPRDFEVPHGDAAWPEDAWGINLGTIVHGVRYYGSYASFVAEDEQHLRIIGFVF